VRARALRAPVFLGSLPRQTGRCAPPPPPCTLPRSYFTPKNILNLSNLCRPRQGPFSFHRNTEAMKYEVHLPPASPIAALLILPAIFWGQNYVPVPPYALIFFCFVFLFYSFWIFSFYYSLPFLLSFSISSYSSLLISSYSSRRCYSSSSFSSPLIF